MTSPNPALAPPSAPPSPPLAALLLAISQPIDNLLTMKEDRDRFFTVYPMIAYQFGHALRNNAKTVKGSEHEELDVVMGTPGDVHFVESEIFNASGVVPNKSCGPDLVAHPEPIFVPHGLPNIALLPRSNTSNASDDSPAA